MKPTTLYKLSAQARLFSWESKNITQTKTYIHNPQTLYTKFHVSILILRVLEYLLVEFSISFRH